MQLSNNATAKPTRGTITSFVPKAYIGLRAAASGYGVGYQIMYPNQVQPHIAASCDQVRIFCKGA